MDSEELIVIKNLCKYYGSQHALNGVDLTLTSGKIVGLAGPNAAGKTTLIKTLCDLLQPTSGEIRIDGHAPGVYTKSIVSYMPDHPSFPDWMKVKDSMDAYEEFYADFDKEKARDICSVLNLDPNASIRALSKGTKEKLQLMLVMSRNAKVYLLDEPLAGVDPAAREFILQTILAKYNTCGTMVISTHLIIDVEKVLDEVVFMSNGKVILHRAVDEIRETEGKSVDELFRDMFRFAM